MLDACKRSLEARNGYVLHVNEVGPGVPRLGRKVTGQRHRQPTELWTGIKMPRPEYASSRLCRSFTASQGELMGLSMGHHRSFEPQTKAPKYGKEGGKVLTHSRRTIARRNCLPSRTHTL